MTPKEKWHYLEDYTRISVGGMSVGVMGLAAAIEAVRHLKAQGDEEVVRDLMDRLSKTNYIAPGSEQAYRRAFLREFKKAVGEKVAEEAGGLVIKILGPGCPSCDSLEQMVMAALMELGIAADVEHVRDPAQIASMRVMGMPALVINGRVMTSGRLPDQATLKRWLTEASGKSSG